MNVRSVRVVCAGVLALVMGCESAPPVAEGTKSVADEPANPSAEPSGSTAPPSPADPTAEEDAQKQPPPNLPFELSVTGEMLSPPGGRLVYGAVVAVDIEDGVSLVGTYVGASGVLGVASTADVKTSLPADARRFVMAHDGQFVCLAVGHPWEQKGAALAMRFALIRPRETASFHELEAYVNHAAYASPGYCLFGGESASVQRVDFGSKKPSVARLDTRGDGGVHTRKAVDFFVDTGDTVIAVDDIVNPFYAFVFEARKEGGVRRLSDAAKIVTLPRGLNKTYPFGTTVGGRVVLQSRFAHRAGSGVIIDVYPEDGSVEESVFRWIESTPRSKGKGATHRFHGKEPTRITGLQGLGDTLFVGAGAKGVLSARIPQEPPTREEHDAKPLPFERHDLGGAEVVALSRLGGRLYALLRKGTSVELALLEWDAKTRRLGVASTVPIEGESPRFVEGFEPE